MISSEWASRTLMLRRRSPMAPSTSGTARCANVTSSPPERGIEQSSERRAACSSSRRHQLEPNTETSGRLARERLVSAGMLNGGRAVPRSRGLSHVAMSVAMGTLTDSFRDELLAFYGEHFGWSEIESLRLTDRLTVAVGAGNYVNIRERTEPMVCDGYEHFGLLLRSPGDVEEAWTALERDKRETHLEPLDRGDDGYRSFRFRFLLPLAVEVQFLAQA